jgi:hypothetical protein
MSVLQFASIVNAKEMSCDTDSYLCAILDQVGELTGHEDIRSLLVAYKEALRDLTDFKTTIETSSVDYSEAVSDLDSKQTMEIKILYASLMAKVIEARSACYTDLSNGFCDFMVDLQQAKFKLTVRILTLLKAFGSEGMSWDNVFGSYFELWMAEHRKLLYRYRSHHSLVAHLKKDPTYVDQTDDHPHLAIHIAIHEQKYAILRATKSSDDDDTPLYTDIPDSYVSVGKKSEMMTPKELRQYKLCKQLPKVLFALNSRNNSQLYKVKLFLKVFSHSIMTSYIAKQLANGVNVQQPDEVDFSVYNNAVGFVVTDNATMMFAQLANDGCQLPMSGDIFNSTESVNSLASQAAISTRSIYRSLSPQELEKQLGENIPLRVPTKIRAPSSVNSAANTKKHKDQTSDQEEREDENDDEEEEEGEEDEEGKDSEDETTVVVKAKRKQRGNSSASSKKRRVARQSIIAAAAPQLADATNNMTDNALISAVTSSTNVGYLAATKGSN